LQTIVSITASLDFARTGLSKASRIVWFLLSATDDIAQLVFGARTPGK